MQFVPFLEGVVQVQLPRVLVADLPSALMARVLVVSLVSSRVFSSGVSFVVYQLWSRLTAGGASGELQEIYGA